MFNDIMWLMSLFEICYINVFCLCVCVCFWFCLLCELVFCWYYFFARVYSATFVIVMVILMSFVIFWFNIIGLFEVHRLAFFGVPFCLPI